VTPLENSPALRAGVQPGDLIIGVDGGTTAGWTTDQAVREITGKEGSEVTLTIYRPTTGQEIDFVLSRGRIQLTTIRGVERVGGGGDEWNYMLDSETGIAYVRLTGFNPESFDELSKALESARNQGMKGLVLDLRGNPGGLLDVAVEIVSLFVPNGEVVSTIGRVERKQKLNVRGKAQYADLPLVALVNEGSASASEILAGALQDHQRAVVLGARTFGKGSVQRVLALNRRLGIPRDSRSAARLKLTTALYYLPSGRSPHKQTPDAEVWGVEPDLDVELTPKEFGKVMELGQAAFIIHNEAAADVEVDEEAIQSRLAALKVEAVGEDEDDDSQTLLTEDDIALIQEDPYEATLIDPQLQKALLHMRIKLAAGLPWPSTIASRMGEMKPQP
jgi:carboxyl-terminal processing protease